MQLDHLVAGAQLARARVVEAQQLAVADDGKDHADVPSLGDRPGLFGSYLVLDDVEPPAHRQEVLEHLGHLRRFTGQPEQPPGGRR